MRRCAPLGGLGSDPSPSNVLAPFGFRPPQLGLRGIQAEALRELAELFRVDLLVPIGRSWPIGERPVLAPEPRQAVLHGAGATSA